MSGNFRQQQAGVEDGLLSAGFLVLILAIVLVFAWFKAHELIARTVIDMLVFQDRALSVIGVPTAPALSALHAAAPAYITISALIHLVAIACTPGRFLFAAILAALGLVVIAGAPASRFTTALDLDRLIKVQTSVFPTAKAWIASALRPTAPDLAAVRPADPALHAGEWIRAYALDGSKAFDRTRAERALLGQIGPSWEGLAGATGTVRLMMAAAGLHALRRRDDALEILALLADVPDAGRKPEGPAKPIAIPPAALAAADKALEDVDLRDLVTETAGRHAYAHPATMAVLSLARARSGVLAPGQFPVLKLMDRPLWYALHSLGFPMSEAEDGAMPNPRIEAIGARAHYEAERAAGQALHTPQIAKVLDQLAARLAETAVADKPRGRAGT